MVPVIKRYLEITALLMMTVCLAAGCAKREMRIWPTPTSVILMMRRRSFPVTAGHVTIKNI